jgi:hypothetical protein
MLQRPAEVGGGAAAPGPAQDVDEVPDYEPTGIVETLHQGGEISADEFHQRLAECPAGLPKTHLAQEIQEGVNRAPG